MLTNNYKINKINKKCNNLLNKLNKRKTRFNN